MSESRFSPRSILARATLADFCRYLHELGPGYAGMVGEACTCPVARYLRRGSAGSLEWDVSADEVSAFRLTRGAGGYEDLDTFSAPDWIRVVVRAVDSGPEPIPHPLSGDDVLKRLRVELLGS